MNDEMMLLGMLEEEPEEVEPEEPEEGGGKPSDTTPTSGGPGIRPGNTPTDIGATTPTVERYTVPEEPTYNEQIRKLQDTDPAQASTIFNPLIQQILNNIFYLYRNTARLVDGQVDSDVLPNMTNYLQYGETDGTAGKFDQLTAAPTVTTNPLRYNGTFRATQVRGMYFSDNADVAEMYQTAEPVSKGDLLMICEGGEIRKNTITANPKVLGIVSTAPAMTLGEGKGNAAIALAGRVPVHVVGAVDPGDFLVGSDKTPGALQRANSTSPRGSIVAQALEGGYNCDVLALVVRL